MFRRKMTKQIINERNEIKKLLLNKINDFINSKYNDNDIFKFIFLIKKIVENENNDYGFMFVTKYFLRLAPDFNIDHLKTLMIKYNDCYFDELNIGDYILNTKCTITEVIYRVIDKNDKYVKLLDISDNNIIRKTKHGILNNLKLFKFERNNYFENDNDLKDNFRYFSLKAGVDSIL